MALQLELDGKKGASAIHQFPIKRPFAIEDERKSWQNASWKPRNRSCFPGISQRAIRQFGSMRDATYYSLPRLKWKEDPLFLRSTHQGRPTKEESEAVSMSSDLASERLGPFICLPASQRRNRSSVWGETVNARHFHWETNRERVTRSWNGTVFLRKSLNKGSNRERKVFELNWPAW